MQQQLKNVVLGDVNEELSSEVVVQSTILEQRAKGGIGLDLPASCNYNRVRATPPHYL